MKIKPREKIAKRFKWIKEINSNFIIRWKKKVQRCANMKMKPTWREKFYKINKEQIYELFDFVRKLYLPT